MHAAWRIFLPAVVWLAWLPGPAGACGLRGNPVHDARGSLVTIPRPTDPTQSYACVYDAWDRLVKVSTTGGSPLAVAKYEYDGLRRRVKTAYDSHGPEDLGGTVDRRAGAAGVRTERGPAR